MAWSVPAYLAQGQLCYLSKQKMHRACIVLRYCWNSQHHLLHYCFFLKHLLHYCWNSQLAYLFNNIFLEQFLFVPEYLFGTTSFRNILSCSMFLECFVLFSYHFLFFMERLYFKLGTNFPVEHFCLLKINFLFLRVEHFVMKLFQLHRQSLSIKTYPNIFRCDLILKISSRQIWLCVRNLI